jgi:hypothetical protein
MNERIKELAEKAKLFTGWPNGETEYQKFAELIVRECANRATWAQDIGEQDIGGEVLKHFGVEE